MAVVPANFRYLVCFNLGQGLGPATLRLGKC